MCGNTVLGGGFLFLAPTERASMDKNKSAMDIFNEAQQDVRPKKHFLVEFSVDDGKSLIGEETFSPTSEEAIDSAISSYLMQGGGFDWMAAQKNDEGPFETFEALFGSFKENSKYEKWKKTAKVRLLEDVPAKSIKAYRQDRAERGKNFNQFREKQNKENLKKTKETLKIQHRSQIMMLLFLILLALLAILFS